MQCQMWLIIPWFLVKIRPKLPKISSEDLTKNCLKLRLKIRPKNCLILLLKIRPKNCFKIAYEDLLINQMPVRLLPVGLLQVRLLPVDFCWSDFCQLDFCQLDFCQLDFCQLDFCQLDFCMSGSYDNCRLRHLLTVTLCVLIIHAIPICMLRVNDCFRLSRPSLLLLTPKYKTVNNAIWQREQRLIFDL